jgi:hypothetical protein
LKDVKIEMPLWIGLLEGKPLVYDKEIQLDACPHVFLWNAETRQMEKYAPSIVRPILRTADKNFERAPVEAAYQAWRLSESITWLHEQREYYSVRSEREHAVELENQHRIAAAAERHEQRMADVAIRHKLHLAACGLQDQGTMRYEGTRRQTRCWSCHAHLDSKLDIACNRCGWLICECGACGCGFPDE